MSVEHALVSYILDTGDIIGVIDAQITDEYFQDQRALKSFVWLRDQWLKHGEVVSAEGFARQFPTFRFPPWNGDPLSFIVEEARKRYALSAYSDGIPSLIEKLKVGRDEVDPDLVTAELRELLNNVEVTVHPPDSEHLADIIYDYLYELTTRAENPVIGMPTGFKTIDAASGGLRPEQLYILGGPPKAGKSSLWLQAALSSARHVMPSGDPARVGCVGFEMSNDEQKERTLGFTAGISTTAVQRGNFSDIERVRLDKAADALSKLRITFIHDVDAASTISGLAAQVRKYQLDALYVDGIYHMTDESATRADNETSRLTHISRGLKRLTATEGIPVFATTQTLMSKMANRGKTTTTESFGWTSAFAQDANVLLGLDRPDTNRPEALLKVLIARHLQGMEVPILIDHTRGIIAEFSGENFKLNYGGSDGDDDDS